MKGIFLFAVFLVAVAEETSFSCFEGNVQKGGDPPTNRVTCNGVLPACYKAVGDQESYYGCLWNVTKFDCEAHFELCSSIHEVFVCKGDACNASTSIHASAVLIAVTAFAKIMA